MIPDLSSLFQTNEGNNALCHGASGRAKNPGRLSRKMPRPSKDWQPVSQRHCSDIRRAEASAAEAVRLAEVKEEEKQHTVWHRSSERAEVKRLAEELKDFDSDFKGPSLAGLHGTVDKLKPQSATFYDHVTFGYEWLKRYNLLDIPPLIAAVLKRLDNEMGEDLRWKTLMDEGMTSARNALLHEHEKQISKHLTETARAAGSDEAAGSPQRLPQRSTCWAHTLAEGLHAL